MWKDVEHISSLMNFAGVCTPKKVTCNYGGALCRLVERYLEHSLHDLLVTL